jgi:bifunctional UDP-N-acetylglucosamine pyrophosphorylase/glucosamine-1-phosphate N-acetyltransferase
LIYFIEREALKVKGNCTVILAAGDGVRMKSSKPKVLAEVLFKPMIDWVIDCALDCGFDESDICVVTGHGRELLNGHLPSGVQTVVQEERLGTGHAVMRAQPFIEANSYSNVLVLNGDSPMVDGETLKLAFEYHMRSGNAATVISANVENPTGYGRIKRNSDGIFEKIVEEKDADENEKNITEVNSGAYWFGCRALLVALDKLKTDAKYRLNAAKEYYLTDAVEILKSMGQRAATFNSKNSDAVLGANDRLQLMRLNEKARMRVLEAHMKNGVSVPFADGVIIGPDVVIGADTEILPGTTIKGKTVIGRGCVVGSNSCIESCVIGDEAVITSSHCSEAEISAGAAVGPFARIRPGTKIDSGARIGNFVEVKNSSIGEGTKISHLSYIGDSDIGTGVNIGSGCATVNYSGKEKFRTVIEDGAFIGCDTSLVAPVKVGENAYTAAGSTITEDVPANSLAVARERQVNKKDWVKSKKPYRK